MVIFTIWANDIKRVKNKCHRIFYVLALIKAKKPIGSSKNEMCRTEKKCAVVLGTELENQEKCVKSAKCAHSESAKKAPKCAGVLISEADFRGLLYPLISARRSWSCWYRPKS